VSKHIIVFAKTPLPGLVKTRLHPVMSPQEAAALAEAFLRDTLALAETRDECWLTLAWHPRGTRRLMRALAGRDWSVRLQRGQDLGERLDRMFQALLGPGDANRALAIGADGPQMPPERLAEAFEALERADLVLGPCEDGGFYLLGLRQWVPRLLDAVRWSTEHALADVLAGAERLGLAHESLATGYDVDDPPGLARLVGDLRRLPPDRAPHTRAELRRQGR
jgi:rSAM/selenodomain-associated transferase 1